MNATTVGATRFAWNAIRARKQGARFFNPEDVGIAQWTSVPDHFPVTVRGKLHASAAGRSALRDGRSECVSGQPRRHARARRAPVRDRRHVVAGRRRLAGAHPRRRRHHHQREQHRECPGRLHARQADRDAAVDAEHQQPVAAVRRPLRAGHVAHERPLHAELRRAVGAVLPDSCGRRIPTAASASTTSTSTRSRPASKSVVFPTAPAGFTYPSQNEDGTGPADFEGHSAVPTRLNKWAPRIGIGWDPTGTARTSVRASYGIANDVVELEGAAQLEQRVAVGGGHHPPHGHAGQSVAGSGRRQPVPVRLAGRPRSSCRARCSFRSTTSST